MDTKKDRTRLETLLTNKESEFNTIIYAIYDNTYILRKSSDLHICNDNHWSIAHELAFHNELPIDISIDILNITTNNNISVKDILMENYGYSEHNIYISVTQVKKFRLGHMCLNHKFTTEPSLYNTMLVSAYFNTLEFNHENILYLSNSNGWSIAHELASSIDRKGINKFLQFSQNIFNIIDITGKTVKDILDIRFGKIDLDIQAYYYTNYEKDINWYNNLCTIISNSKSLIHKYNYWAVRYPDSNRTIAHEWVKYNQLPNEFYNLYKSKDNNGWSVAHEAAKYNNLKNFIDDIELLKITSKRNWSVAHTLAKYTDTLNNANEHILKLETDTGWTVAHELAKWNRLSHDISQDILDYKTNQGLSVLDLMTSYKCELPICKCNSIASSDNTDVEYTYESIQSIVDKNIISFIEDIYRSKPNRIYGLTYYYENRESIIEQLHECSSITDIEKQIKNILLSNIQV